MDINYQFARVSQFQKISKFLTPFLLCLLVLFGTTGLYYALLSSPADYQQGDSVRFMYIHVPAAWLSVFIYGSMATAAFIYLVFKHQLALVYCQAASSIGLFFTFVCLITGSLWGKLMWGSYWVWDARLTSVFILFLLYAGYMLLISQFEHKKVGHQMGCVLLLLGAVNLPIIKFSVTWWNTLHQPASLMKLSKPSIDPSMLKPLMIMALFYFCSAAYSIILKMNIIIAKRKLARLMNNGAAPYARFT